MGAITVALINKKPRENGKPKGLMRSRLPWPSILLVVFSALMVASSGAQLLKYWNSISPASARTVVSVLTYGASVFLFLVIGTWNARVIAGELHQRRSNERSEGTAADPIDRHREKTNQSSLTEKLILSHRSRVQSLNHAADILGNRLAELEAVAQEIIDKGPART